MFVAPVAVIGIAAAHRVRKEDANRAAGHNMSRALREYLTQPDEQTNELEDREKAA